MMITFALQLEIVFGSYANYTHSTRNHKHDSLGYVFRVVAKSLLIEGASLSLDIHDCGAACRPEEQMLQMDSLLQPTEKVDQ